MNFFLTLLSATDLSTAEEKHKSLNNKSFLEVHSHHTWVLLVQKYSLAIK